MNDSDGIVVVIHFIESIKKYSARAKYSTTSCQGSTPDEALGLLIRILLVKGTPIHIVGIEVDS